MGLVAGDIAVGKADVVPAPRKVATGPWVLNQGLKPHPQHPPLIPEDLEKCGAQVSKATWRLKT